MHRQPDPSRKPQAAFRPRLEMLEDRTVPAVSYHGGPLLTGVQVETVFYGPAWTTNAALLQQAQLQNSFYSFITNSGFMDLLQQYGVGRGQFVGADFNPAVPGNGLAVDDSAIETMLVQQIGRGLLTRPNAQTLYVVYTPPGVEVTAGNENSINSFLGYHSVFFDPTVGTVYYAVIDYPSSPNALIPGLTAFQQSTVVSSHELAEAVTDPDAQGGWYNNRQGTDGEIGDLATNLEGVYGGYLIQGVWSNAANGPVLPGAATGTPGLPTNLLQMADAFTHSAEYLSNIVVNDYQQFLGRTPTTQEVSLWVNAMEHGVTDEQVLADFVGSPEFYQHAGGTNQTYVAALYQDLLGRSPDAASGSWVNALNAGGNRYQIAGLFATSTEREGDVVESAYQYYLGRSGSSGEIAQWVNGLRSGMTDEEMVAGLVASLEFFNDHGGTPAGWLTAVYQVVLHRQPDPASYNAILQALEAATF